MTSQLSLDDIQHALRHSAPALRAVTRYQPAGGQGDKVFPPTYEGGRYAEEERYLEGVAIPCVVLDSVQSQANRMELALLEAWEARNIPLPVVTVDFTGYNLPKPFSVTSLEAPHRIADALLRDSEHDGLPFRQTDIGRTLDTAELKNAAPLFELCPTALVFGIWDSTGERGGLGAKFQRALVSEIVGLHAHKGTRTSSRIDPAQISSHVTIYKADNPIGYTPDPEEAKKDNKGNPVLFDRGRSGQGKPGNPSKANHGNVTPTKVEEVGGVTISQAVQTTVLSLSALRRLRFPLADSRSDPEIDLAARTALAAQALYAATLVREQGADLRSRCQLVAAHSVVWELLGAPGAAPQQFSLEAESAESIYRTAVNQARERGLPWLNDELVLRPSEPLLSLVRRSQELAVGMEVDEAEGA